MQQQGQSPILIEMEAQNIEAAGLTIDELRGKLDEALSKFYQNPRTIITPALVERSSVRNLVPAAPIPPSTLLQRIPE